VINRHLGIKHRGARPRCRAVRVRAVLRHKVHAQDDPKAVAFSRVCAGRVFASMASGSTLILRDRPDNGVRAFLPRPRRRWFFLVSTRSTTSTRLQRHESRWPQPAAGTPTRAGIFGAVENFRASQRKDGTGRAVRTIPATGPGERPCRECIKAAAGTGRRHARKRGRAPVLRWRGRPGTPTRAAKNDRLWKWRRQCFHERAAVLRATRAGVGRGRRAQGPPAPRTTYLKRARDHAPAFVGEEGGPCQPRVLGRPWAVAAETPLSTRCPEMVQRAG